MLYLVVLEKCLALQVRIPQASEVLLACLHLGLHRCQRRLRIRKRGRRNAELRRDHRSQADLRVRTRGNGKPYGEADATDGMLEGQSGRLSLAARPRIALRSLGFEVRLLPSIRYDRYGSAQQLPGLTDGRDMFVVMVMGHVLPASATDSLADAPS